MGHMKMMVKGKCLRIYAYIVYGPNGHIIKETYVPDFFPAGKRQWGAVGHMKMIHAPIFFFTRPEAVGRCGPYENDTCP